MTTLGFATFKFADIPTPSKTYGYVDVTAAKSGQASVTKRFEVFVDNQAFSVPVLGAISPTVITLLSTSDGVVKTYSGATIYGSITIAGVIDTANWNITYTTSHVGLTLTTPGVGSWVITAMPSSSDLEYVYFTATKSGFAPITATIAVNKNKGTGPSGPLVTAFAGVSSYNEYIAIKFKTNGEVDVKYSSGGSFALLTNWYAPTTTNIGNSYWVRVEVDSGPTLDGASSNINEWLALSIERTYIQTRASSGTSKTYLKIFLANNSGGTGVTSYATTFLEASKA